MKCLLIEDDARLAGHLISSLRDQGFIVTHAWNRHNIFKILSESSVFDIVILDRMLGTLDAKEFVSEIKRKWPTAPILVLSAISTPNERTDLLDMGADDYIGKPFSTNELIARLRALVRRNHPPSANFIKIGNLVIDFMKRIVSIGDTAENLPAKEFLLLRALSQEVGRVWSKTDLLDYVWGHNVNVDSNVVEATVTNLRKRLAAIGAHVQIKNMRNVGYWIES
jgi:DNA-binding response OmpR family regulator